MLPTGQDVAAPLVSNVVNAAGERGRRERGLRDGLPGPLPISVPLNRQRVTVGRVAIDPETAAERAPAVMGALPVGEDGVVHVVPLGVHSVVGSVVDRAAVSYRADLLLVPAHALKEKALRVAGGLADDVNAPVDGVGPPERGTRAANHFDLLQVRQHVVHAVPIDARERRGVKRSAVHQHE